MRPKGKMIALLAIFAAIGMVVATGAFTSVQAERTVSVNVADDSNALLQLEANSTANGDYVTTENNQLLIDLDGSIGDGAQGLNPNANTTFGSLFDVTNQGTQDVSLSSTINVDQSDDNTDGSPEDAINLYEGNNTGTDLGTTSLSPGDGVPIGLQIDLTDQGSEITEGDFNATITIEATATDQ